MSKHPTGAARLRQDRTHRPKRRNPFQVLFPLFADDTPRIGQPVPRRLPQRQVYNRHECSMPHWLVECSYHVPSRVVLRLKEGWSCSIPPCFARKRPLVESLIQTTVQKPKLNRSVLCQRIVCPAVLTAAQAKRYRYG